MNDLELVKILENYSKRTIITSISLIILSILIIVNPDTFVKTIIKIIGFLCILDGVYHIISYINKPNILKTFSYDLTIGLGEIILGFIFIIHSSFIISFIYLIFGLFILIQSIIKLQIFINIKKYIPNWILGIIVCICSIIFSIIMIMYPLIISNYITLILGIILLITEILNLIEGIYFYIKLKTI